MPGHALTWTPDGGETIRRYWGPPPEADIHRADAAVEALAAILPQVVTDQLQSDVPVTTFLSGGIDSSLVTAIASDRGRRRLDAFTMGFEEKRSDERAFAALAAEACGARQIVGVLRAGDVDTLIGETMEAFDEPFGIGAALPMVALSRLAADHGAKVVLTGDGADELFAGYRHYDGLAAHYRLAGRSTGRKVSSRLRAAWARVRRGRFDPLDAYKSHNAELFGAPPRPPQGTGAGRHPPRAMARGAAFRP